MNTMEEVRLDEGLVLKTSRSVRIGLWVRILLLPLHIQGRSVVGNITACHAEDCEFDSRVPCKYWGVAELVYAAGR